MYACFPKLKEKNLAHLKSNEQWEEGVQRAWAVVLTVLSLGGDMSVLRCGDTARWGNYHCQSTSCFQGLRYISGIMR